MNIKNRQQLLTILAIAGIGLLGLDKLVLSPLMASWDTRTKQIADLKKNIIVGQGLVDQEQSIRRRWESMRTNTLPSNVSQAEAQMFRAFDRWSQDSRITIASIKPQWKRLNDEYMTYECRADAMGSMSAITRFLYQVERDPLAVKVEAVELTSRDNNGQVLNLGLQISGLLLNPPQE
jgi:hypothetical protein